MLKVLKIVIVLVVVAVGGLFAVAATRPDTFQVARSVAIKAPPEKVFALINDLRAFNTWNPFVRSDPTLPLSYSGPASGPGAVYAFGPGKGGTGSISIVEATPPSRVLMRLDMAKPMQASNRVEFTLQPRGDSTVVQWAMSGSAHLIAKVVHLFIDVDTMVGGEFETGLAGLKVLAEK